MSFTKSIPDYSLTIFQNHYHTDQRSCLSLKKANKKCEYKKKVESLKQLQSQGRVRVIVRPDMCEEQLPGSVIAGFDPPTLSIVMIPLRS